MAEEVQTPQAPDLYDERYYINRELSWLEFNRRCLAEAMDDSNPLLERVQFLAICYGNMDEFFMIRVPGIMAKTPIPGPDYLYVNYNVLMEQISTTVQELVQQYGICWNELKRCLADKDIHIKKVSELNPDQQAWVAELYKERVHPLLTPLALDVSHPFPFISNNSLNIAVRMFDSKHEQLFARVKVPVGPLPRFVQVPSPSGLVFVMLEDIIETHISALFPGLEVDGAYVFRVTRNADVKVTIDEACDFMTAVEESLEDRDVGFPVRMVAEGTMPTEMVKLFARNLKLTGVQVHRTDAIMLVDLWQLVGLDFPKLKDKPFEQYTPPELAEGMDIFEAIRQKDWILFHPYESFSTIVRFMQTAADDSQVQSIKICLYRIGKDPSIIKALMRARENGKTVSVLMELRAKFDESNNIRWSRELEKIGVHVVYGPVDLKVHSKLLQVVRLEGNKLVRYTHMSSGILWTQDVQPPPGRAPHPEEHPHQEDREGDRGPQGQRERVHCDEGQRSHRLGHYRLPVQGIDRGREDRSEHQGTVLPQARNTGRVREHQGHQHRRPLPGALQDLLLRERRPSRDVHGFIRHDAEEPPGQGRGPVPCARQGDDGEHQGAHPEDPPSGQRQGQGAAPRRNVQAGREGRGREEAPLPEVVH